MKKIKSLFRWLLGKTEPASDPLGRALEAFRDPLADPLELSHRLVACLRPKTGATAASCNATSAC